MDRKEEKFLEAQKTLTALEIPFQTSNGGWSLYCTIGKKKIEWWPTTDRWCIHPVTSKVYYGGLESIIKCFGDKIETLQG